MEIFFNSPVHVLWFTGILTANKMVLYL